MSNSLPDIKKVFYHQPTGSSVGYYFNPEILISDQVTFSEIDFDSVSFTQTRNVNSRGVTYTKQFDFEFGDISQVIDLNNSIILFTDANNNSYLTGHEKFYSTSTSTGKIDDTNNVLSVSIQQTSYEEIKAIDQYWYDSSSSIDFPRGSSSVPSGFTGTTGGSIILSWVNPSYDVQYQSFSLVRTNASGGTTSISINDINSSGYTDSPDYFYAGTYLYKLALAQNLNGGKPYQYTDTISIDTYNPNTILDLTGTSSMNSINLVWTNPANGFKGGTYQSFSIIRTNPESHPSGATTNLYLNDITATTYQDLNVGEFTGDYSYVIAPCLGLNGTNPNQYSNTANVHVQNYNIPYNLFTTVSGNSIILNWTNLTYTINVQSFSINRCEDIGGGNIGNCTVLTFNDNGTATSYVDENIGQYAGTGKTYYYQIAVAKQLDGFDRQEYTYPLISENIYNHNTPPTFWMTGGYSGPSKYYGLWDDIQPTMTVSGGSGIVTVRYYDTLSGGFLENHDIDVNCTGGVFNVALTGLSRTRSFVSNYSWHIDLSGSTSSGYTVGGSNNPITLQLPKRISNPITGITAYDDGFIDWSQIKSDTGCTVQYGYVINRYKTSDFYGSNTIVGFVSGNSNTSYQDPSPPTGLTGYTYYVRGASLSGNTYTGSSYTSDASSLVVPISSDFTVTILSYSGYGGIFHIVCTTSGQTSTRNVSTNNIDFNMNYYPSMNITVSKISNGGFAEDTVSIIVDGNSHNFTIGQSVSTANLLTSLTRGKEIVIEINEGTPP